MEIHDLMNINELSVNFDLPSKIFSIHTFIGKPPQISVTSYIFYSTVKHMYHMSRVRFQQQLFSLVN